MDAVLLAAVFAWVGCSDATGPADQLAAVVESQSMIVSEGGELRMTRGTLAVQSISMIGSDRDVSLVGPMMLDLTLEAQSLPLQSEIPGGEYTGLRVELAPATDGFETLDVDIQSLATGGMVRATSTLRMSGEVTFPEGPRSVGDNSEFELHVQLRGMFFYLSPMQDAVVVEHNQFTGV